MADTFIGKNSSHNEPKIAETYIIDRYYLKLSVSMNLSDSIFIIVFKVLIPIRVNKFLERFHSNVVRWLYLMNKFIQNVSISDIHIGVCNI